MDLSHAPEGWNILHVERHSANRCWSWSTDRTILGIPARWTWFSPRSRLVDASTSDPQNRTRQQRGRLCSPRNRPPIRRRKHHIPGNHQDVSSPLSLRARDSLARLPAARILRGQLLEFEIGRVAPTEFTSMPSHRYRTVDGDLRKGGSFLCGAVLAIAPPDHGPGAFLGWRTPSPNATARTRWESNDGALCGFERAGRKVRR